MYASQWLALRATKKARTYVNTNSVLRYIYGVDFEFVPNPQNGIIYLYHRDNLDAAWRTILVAHQSNLRSEGHASGYFSQLT